jgi:C4-dicarboxylate-binding protein DctP
MKIWFERVIFMFSLSDKITTIIICLIGFLYATSVTAQTEFRIAFQTPLNHHLAKNILFFKEELEVASGGSIQVRINDYGSYLKELKNKKNLDEKPQYFLGKDMLQAVQDKHVEIGMISLHRFSESIPLTDIFYQPFLLDTEKKVTDIVKKNSIVRRSIENSVQNLGATVLWWQPYGSVVHVSKGGPVQNPDQMKDRKVRVFNKTLGNLVLASGGTPLAIPNSQQYFAYRHQKVDIGMTTIADIREKKIWEVMDTVSITNSASVQFLLVANSSWWNSLSNNVRQTVSRAAYSAERRSIEELKKIEISAYNEAIQNGMNLVILSNDDKDYWKEKSGPIYKKFLARTGSNGQAAFDLVISY